MITNIKGYIESLKPNELWKFYKSKEWLALKELVLREHHYECQECKKRGKITKADTVHHIKHVRDHPELALTKSNLEPVCKACHNKLHPEKFKKNTKKKFWTIERW
ncbi:MAG: HNH endonuclease [Peptostreptococcaceae bacterium]|nr:HNH endonuclease [Peptostreptococcaceae bacterium]